MNGRPHGFGPRDAVDRAGSDLRRGEGLGPIEELQMSGDVDRAVIAELDKEGLLDTDTLVHLEDAVRWSFAVGVALGIIMAARRVDESTSFELLQAATRRTRRSVRALAEYIRHTRDLTVLS